MQSQLLMKSVASRPRRAVEDRAVCAEEVLQARAEQQSWTDLHKASQAGDVQEVKRLLNEGADKEARSAVLRRTPLHLAAARGHAGLLPLLITSATLKAQDKYHFTPLHSPIKANQPAAVDVLVDAGAPLDAPDPGPESPWARPQSPLALAMDCLCRHKDLSTQPAMKLVTAMVANLESAGAPAEAAQGLQQSLTSALCTAAELDCPDLVSKLLGAGADQHVTTGQGRTLLWMAAASGSAKLVPLLANPSNIDLAAASGATPLHMAAAMGHAETVRALLAAGATVTALDSSGRSALVLAAKKGSDEVVALLVAAGAAAGMSDTQGRRALAAAALQDHTPVVRLLLEVLVRGGSQPAQQAQGQAQPQGQPSQDDLMQLLVAAAAPLAGCSFLCSSFLEVVLDVLGPGVVGNMCLEVQKQLKAALGAGEPPMNCSRDKWCQAPEVSHLAEALLLCWARAASGLHASRQLLVARLQDLVPAVGTAAQQQQRKHEQESSRRSSQDKEVHQQLVQLVVAAESAAAAGQEERSLGLLAQAGQLLQQNMGGACVELDHYHTYWHTLLHCGEVLCPALPLMGAPDSGLHGGNHQHGSPLLACLLHQGLVQAARARMAAGSSSSASNGEQPLDPQAEREARSFRPDPVYTTLVAAWVEARKRLKKQLQEQVKETVVAAVKAARQQQQVEDEAEEAELLSELLAILNGTDENGEAPSG